MLHCRSISHQNAPLSIREKIDFTTEYQRGWLCQQASTDIVVLSTCNRLELYAFLPSSQQMDDLWANLLSIKEIAPHELAPYTTHLTNYEAAHHLFQVTSSLRSMALGEAQILGQVIQAFEQAQQCNTSGHNISMLFRGAIHAAKRIHSETGINEGNISVSSLGINRMEQLFGSLENHSILVIGAGEMGQQVIKGLDRRHLTDVTLVSRTHETAKQVAATWHIKASPITHLKDLLSQVDIVFTTSSAPFPILSAEDIEPIMQARDFRALYIVDIALPRDVSPEVNHIMGVTVFDLDDLQQVVEENNHLREASIPLAHHIISEELAHYWHELEGREVVPTIRQLREQIDTIREAELQRIYHKLSHVSTDEVTHLFEEFSHRFMNKVLHQPTQNLRVKAGQGNGALFTSVARDLFGLEE